MELEDFKLEENEKINSSTLNQYFLNAYTDISNLFDFCFETMGKLEVLNVAVKLLDNSNKKVIQHLELSNTISSDISIDVGSNIIYPTSVTINERADILSNFGIILNKIISKNRIFTTLADKQRIIKDGVKVKKSSNNFIYLNKPDYVYESNILDVLLGEYPYVVRMYGSEVYSSNLILEITSDYESFNFNTIEYIPFPIAGLMEINGIRINDIDIANTNDYIFYTDETKHARTEASYIPFNPIKGNRLTFNVECNARIQSLNSSCVGVELIEAYETTYASTSYFGYSFKMQANRKLKNVLIDGNWVDPQIKNVKVRFYDSVDEFNSVSDNYLISIDDSIKSTVNLVKDKTYWVLFILENVNSYPQCIKNIGINFQ